MSEIKLLMSPTFDIPDGHCLIGLGDGTYVVTPEPMDIYKGMDWAIKVTKSLAVSAWSAGRGVLSIGSPK